MAHERWRRRTRARIKQTLDIIERAFDGVPPPDEDHRTLYQANAWDADERIDQRREHVEAPAEILLAWRRVLTKGDDESWFDGFY